MARWMDGGSNGGGGVKKMLRSFFFFTLCSLLIVWRKLFKDDVMQEAADNGNGKIENTNICDESLWSTGIKRKLVKGTDITFTCTLYK